jgi:polyhydroxyalkanoate synthesis regulator phasin
VSDSQGLFDRLKARGEEVWSQLSTELMSNEHFVKAMQGAVRGKERLNEAVGTALKTMNVPTRTEFKRAVARIDALEKELAAVKARGAARPKPAPPKKAASRKKPAARRPRA